MAEFRLQTERLILRSWREEDLESFAAICADPLVMATLGPVMNRDETRALVARECAIEAEHGHTFWVVERREDQRLIGKCGIIIGRDGPIAGRPEIGWRLAADCWGHGYITEAARGCVDWFFAHCDADSLWAITSTGNQRSRAVMDRLGMILRPELEFYHPRLAPESPLRRHVVYELPRQAKD
ncbi:MAG: hypothetical protein RLZZ136_723 [Pseudomonadota bacterium]